MKSLTDVICGGLVLLFCVVGAYSLSSLPPGGTLENVGPAGMPGAVLYILGALGCLLIYKGLRRYPSRAYWPEAPIFKKTLLFLALIYAYVTGLIVLGDVFQKMENPPLEHGNAFSTTTLLFLLIALPMLGRKKPVEVLSVAGITTALLVLVFGNFFQVLLP